MGILFRAKALVVDRFLRRGGEKVELVSAPRIGGDLHPVASRRSDYLVLALRLAGRWGKDKGSVKEILDALLLLEEAYGTERVLAAVKRPFALLAAVTKASSLTSLASERGFPTVGAFVGSEVEEELRGAYQGEAEVIFRHPSAGEGGRKSAVAGEYPTYRDWKEASLLAQGMGRMHFLPLLAALVLRLRKEDPGTLRALVKSAKCPSQGLEKGGATQLGSRSLTRLLEQTIADLDEQDPSPLWRILRRALSGGYRDG